MSSDPRKKLCVVFDIDETLIHFIPSKYSHLWDKLSPELQAKFTMIPDGKNIFILRPYIRELFEYFKANSADIKVALWTYSERTYAEDIARHLTSVLQLPADFFMFKWGAEDMDEEGVPKDLRQVYASFPNFNKFNTFIVDDLHGNITHNVNKENSILVEPFAPFGTSKVRLNIGSEAQNKLSANDAFIKLQGICEKAIKDIRGCDTEDIDTAFDTEAIFCPHRVKRMSLTELMKTYAVSFVNLLTLGQPMQTRKFVNVDCSKYSEHVKGGTNSVKGRTKRKKNRNGRRKVTRRRK